MLSRAILRNMWAMDEKELMLGPANRAITIALEGVHPRDSRWHLQTRYHD